MGNLNSTCTQDQIWHTQRCYVSPFASANPMCVDPDPTKCNSTTQLQTCDPGYYCPNVTAGCEITYPQFCPPTVDCATQRFGSSFCAPQGVFEPQLCLPGHYCPDQYTMLPCPVGSYCMRGSVEPTQCSLFSYCPAQTPIRRYYGGMLFSGFVDVLLVLLFLFVRFRLEPARARARERAGKRRNGESFGDASDGEPLQILRGFKDEESADDSYAAMLTDSGAAAEYASPQKILEEGFTRCNLGIQLDIEFKDLTYKVRTPQYPEGRSILTNVSGRVRPRRVTAVMGPSGAGKSTFVNVLMGKLKRESGDLRINGQADDMFRYKRMVGFVPQDDNMIMELTVRENILFSARVRLPRTGWTDAAIERHVDAVIDVLDLSHVSNNLITAVSGGQRKRANIGIELAIAPAAIFLDEPTSGLDAAQALEVCATLRHVADLGITVVAVIHQPRTEIFRKFDDLILLSPGGNGVGGLTAYFGPQRLVVPYFSELGVNFDLGFNPADDLLDFLQSKGEVGKAAVEGGQLKVLRDRAVDVSTDSSSISSQSDANIATQIAAYWNLEGPGFIAKKRLEEGAGSFTPSALGDSERKVTAYASVQDGGDEEHRPFDVDAATALRGATFLRQLLLVFNRSILQQYRTYTSFILELGVALLAGFMMGAASLAVPSLYIGVLKAPYVYISPSPVESLLPSIGLFVGLAVSIAASPAGVKTFGEERLIYFREASAGHNRLSYYIAKTLAVIPRLTIGAFHFVSIFHLLARPTSPFPELFMIVWCQYFCVYGLSAITSMLVKRENAPLLGVIASLVAATLNGYGPSLRQGREWGVGWVQDSSFARWANEAWFESETRAYRRLFMVAEVSAGVWGYTLDRLGADFAIMIVLGLVYRAVAFGFLIGLNREQQK